MDKTGKTIRQRITPPKKKNQFNIQHNQEQTIYRFNIQMLNCKSGKYEDVKFYLIKGDSHLERAVVGFKKDENEWKIVEVKRSMRMDAEQLSYVILKLASSMN